MGLQAGLATEGPALLRVRLKVQKGGGGQISVPAGALVPEEQRPAENPGGPQGFGPGSRKESQG